MRALSILAVFAVAVTGAVAGAAGPTPSEVLVAAVEDASDPVAIDRAARHLSNRELIALVNGGRRETRAAVFAAAFVGDNVALLGALSDVAGSFDRSLAVPAARAAQQIAASLDGPAIAEREIPRRTLAEAAVAWHRVARDRQLWADVRVTALEVARDLTRLLGGDGTRPVIELVADPDPEVRRAALELLRSPLPAERYRRVAERITGDADPEVALAAAAALCFGVRFGDDAAAIRAAIGEAGLARVAELAADPALSGPARVAAAACLTDDKALRAVRKTLPPELRRQLDRK